MSTPSASKEIYNVVRYYLRATENTLTVKRGLSLEEAQEHCQNPESSSRTATGYNANRHTGKHGPWFDGYVKMGGFQ